MVSFFEHQDRARRNTRVLIALMALGVSCMGLAIYALIAAFNLHLGATGIVRAGGFRLLDPQLMLATVGGTGIIVGLASSWRMLSLPKTGSSVAELLGGRLVSGSPRDQLEKRLLNVVEE